MKGNLQNTKGHTHCLDGAVRCLLQCPCLMIPYRPWNMLSSHLVQTILDEPEILKLLGTSQKGIEASGSHDG